jgi:dienelactone hydrolase
MHGWKAAALAMLFMAAPGLDAAARDPDREAALGRAFKSIASTSSDLAKSSIYIAKPSTRHADGPPPGVIHLGYLATVPRPDSGRKEDLFSGSDGAYSGALDSARFEAGKPTSILLASVSSAGGVLTRFTTDKGVQVRIETFRPAWAGGPVPAVLVLHGASGLGGSSTYYDAARLLVEYGYAAFVVHYFDADGTVSPKPHLRPQTRSDREAAISEAVTHISRLPYVDPSRIGMLGVSLGSFHALSVAARDRRIGAVIGYVGGLSRSEQVERMPPTLILHGDKDRIVPVNRAYDLAAELRRIGATFEMRIYSGEGHGFRGDAQADSRVRMLRFLARHLDGRTDQSEELARVARWTAP